MQRKDTASNNERDSASKPQSENQGGLKERLPSVGVISKRTEDLLESPLLNIANQRNSLYKKLQHATLVERKRKGQYMMKRIQKPPRTIVPVVKKKPRRKRSKTNNVRLNEPSLEEFHESLDSKESIPFSNLRESVDLTDLEERDLTNEDCVDESDGNTTLDDIDDDACTELSIIHSPESSTVDDASTSKSSPASNLEFNKPDTATIQYTKTKLDIQRSKEQLEEKYVHFQHLREKADGQIKVDIESAKQFVPIELMFAHGIGKYASYAHFRAAQLLERMYARVYTGTISMVFSKWNGQTRYLRKLEQETSAGRIQRLWKRYHTKTKFVKISKEGLLLIRREELILKLLRTGETRAAFIVTATVRKYIERRKELEASNRNTAALILQRFFKSLLQGWASTISIGIRVRKEESSIKIQNQVRCWIARRHLKLRRKIKVVAVKTEQAKLIKEKRSERYRYFGAALRIQQLWKRKLKRRTLRYARQRKVNEKRYNAASKIQFAYRFYATRIHTQQKRINEKASSIILQCAFRSYYARKILRIHKTLKATEISKRLMEKKVLLPETVEEEKTVDSSNQNPNEPPEQKDAEQPHEKKKRRKSSSKRKHSQKKEKRSERSSVKRISTVAFNEIRKETAALQVDIKARINKATAVTPEREFECASMLQAHWRGVRARRRMRYKRAAEKEFSRRQHNRKRKKAAIVVQKHWRAILGRKKYWNVKQETSALVLQAEWKGYLMRGSLADLRERLKAVRVIKKYWVQSKTRRVHFGRMWAARRIQALVRGFLHRIVASKVREMRHFHEEEEAQGYCCFIHTVDYIQTVVLRYGFHAKLNSSRNLECYGIFDNPAVAGPWQDLFISACRWGSKNSKSTEIDSVRFSRFFKESPKLINATLTIPVVERTYADVKPKGKGVNFDQFMEAIRKILVIRFEKRSETPKSSASSVAGSRPQSSSTEIQTPLEDHFVTMITQFIYKASWGRPLKQKFQKCAIIRMNWAAKIIQKIIRGLWGRRKFTFTRKQHEKYLEETRVSRMATRIQSLWRVRVARKKMQRIFASVIIEYIDGETGAPYYVNPVTKTTRWYKPNILGNEECDVSIRLPRPGEEFVAYCQHHMRDSPNGTTNVHATIYCRICEVALCPSCLEQAHSRESMKSHATINIERCDICQLQTATRTCNQCGNGKVMYCDTCYPHLHQKEHLASHTYTPLIVMCGECENKAAQWQCHVCNDVFCKSCFAKFHRKGKRQHHAATHMPYFSVLEKHTRELREKRRQEDDARKAYQLRQARILKEKTDREFEHAVIKIQAHYRGRRARREGKEYMKVVRQTQIAVMQREKDDKKRKKIHYRIKDALGKAEDLKSDTMQEKQLRAYKRSMKNRLGMLVGLESEAIKHMKQTASIANAKSLKDAESGLEVPAWCKLGKNIVVTNGEYKGLVASILTTNSVEKDGTVKIFIADATMSVNVSLFDVRPQLSPEEERIKASALLSAHQTLVGGLSTAGSLLGDAKHALSIHLSEKYEQKKMAAQIRLIEMEFSEITEFAWKEMEEPPVAEGEAPTIYWWNVVNNSRTNLKPRGLKNFEAMDDYEAKKEIQAQIDRAEKKMSKIVSTSERYDLGAQGRRNAIEPTFKNKKLVGAANKFYLTIHDDAHGKGAAVKGLDGSSMFDLYMIMDALDDTPAYAPLIGYLCSSSVNEKLETIQEILDIGPLEDKAQSHIIRLSHLSMDDRIQRKQDIEERARLNA